MKYFLLLIMAISSQVYAQEGAFRCNLDLRARILVFQFSKDFIAYDTHKGSFWKYWQASDKKPGVEFVGVYDLNWNKLKELPIRNNSCQASDGDNEIKIININEGNNP